MTKENILRAYLEDDLFIQEKYLKEGDAQKIKWSSAENNLIEIIKMAIEGEQNKDSSTLTERKINALLNR